MVSVTMPTGVVVGLQWDHDYPQPYSRANVLRFDGYCSLTKKELEALRVRRT